MLKLENVSKFYYSGNNVVMALRRIDLEFKPGEFIAITGESGSGKSTLLNVLSGLDTYEDGKIFLNGRDFSHYTVQELEAYRRQYIGFVFQDYNIIDSYTVYQNIEIALTVQGETKKARHKRVHDLIKQVGLEKQTNQKASKLSGGEKQRTVIARALAKNSSIIVCDEPTGNLDVKASESILRLLHEISEDKLVIVVTHNFDEIKEFATRKIRLYDGQIIEDIVLESRTSSKQIELTQVSFQTRVVDLFRIALQNIISVPKKSLFTLLILSFMVLAFIFSYGFTLQEQNKSLQYETVYFENVDQSRLIVTKRDNTAFTEAELAELESLDYVRGVVKYDIVYDTTLVQAVYNDEFEYTEFFDYRVASILALNQFDLTSGRLPEQDLEIVIGESDLYELGDYISITNDYNIKRIEGAITDQFTYKIVGFVPFTPSIEQEKNVMYLTMDAMDEMQYTANYENAQILLDIDHLRQYMIYTDVRIDNTLDDSVFMAYDMMFFDICRDFGYREEIIDDQDAGLCPVDEFFPEHDFSLSIVTKFENTKESIPIIIDSVPVYPHIYGQGVYVNKSTFEALFTDDIYQPSVVVYDMFEAKQVQAELEELGYNAIYPSGILDEDTAIDMILRNIQLLLSLGLMVAAVYFVGYFVMRNVIATKKKDYLIYRSIGTAKPTISAIMVIELLYLTLLSLLLNISLLYINEQFKSQIPHFMRYFGWSEYIIIIGVILILVLMMSHALNKRIFGRSVISSLKAH